MFFFIFVSLQASKLYLSMQNDIKNRWAIAQILQGKLNMLKLPCKTVQGYPARLHAGYSAILQRVEYLTRCYMQYIARYLARNTASCRQAFRLGIRLRVRIRLWVWLGPGYIYRLYIHDLPHVPTLNTICLKCHLWITMAGSHRVKLAVLSNKKSVGHTMLIKSKIVLEHFIDKE